MVSNSQSKSRIISFFLSLFKITSVSLLKTKYSLFLEFFGVGFWFVQLEILKLLIQYQVLTNDLCYVLGWMNLFAYSFIYLKYKAIWLLTIYRNSHVFTEIIMSTLFNDKNKKSFFSISFKIDITECITKCSLQSKPTVALTFFGPSNLLSVGRQVINRRLWPSSLRHLWTGFRSFCKYFHLNTDLACQ